MGEVKAEESSWNCCIHLELRFSNQTKGKKNKQTKNQRPCMVVASFWWHHGMHHQRGSVGGAALHPREELWLHQGGGGARGSGGGRGNAESEGITTLDSHHCSGKPILMCDLCRFLLFIFTCALNQSRRFCEVFNKRV